MSRKFVRNITNTKLKGEQKEPLKTNVQNDLLSDDKDVFVRNQQDYHCLTDNIKEIKSANDSIQVIVEDKNTVTLVGNGGTGGTVSIPEISFRLDDEGNLYYKIEWETKE